MIEWIVTGVNSKWIGGLDSIAHNMAALLQLSSSTQKYMVPLYDLIKHNPEHDTRYQLRENVYFLKIAQT